MDNIASQADTSNGGERNWLYKAGCRISEWVSDIAAHPYAQMGLVVICISWFAFGLDTNLLTAALSILAITLTQMVLNRQNEREAEARRRDIAMHTKLDELIIAARRAHNEMAGIEELSEEEIVELKQQQKVANEEAAEPDKDHPGESQPTGIDEPAS